jgi:hypothetical protein
MICQVCHEPMPFKTADGWYFEAVECIPDRKQLHFQNYLALCPLCAAKYRYARGTPDEVLFRALKDSPLSGLRSVNFTILLNGSRAGLKFTGQHALDLQTVLAVAGDSVKGP